MGYTISEPHEPKPLPPIVRGPRRRTGLGKVLARLPVGMAITINSEDTDAIRLSQTISANCTAYPRGSFAVHKMGERAVQVVRVRP